MPIFSRKDTEDLQQDLSALEDWDEEDLLQSVVEEVLGPV
jgi:hypothetical protein